MALSEKELRRLREIICRSPKPEVMEAYSKMEDDQIRAVLAQDKAKELLRLQSSKIAIETRINEVNSE